jgi:hypothetical protein
VSSGLIFIKDSIIGWDAYICLSYMFLGLLHNGAGSDYMVGDAFLGFYYWRDGLFDRVSPSFFGDRMLDGLL